MSHSILIAIDQSENSLRAVDYVGKMMSCHPDVTVTLLSVIKEPSLDIMPDVEERQFYVEKKRSEILGGAERAAQQLRSYGIPKERIKLKLQVCSAPVTIAGLILDEQARENHGTIVVGRRGMSKREEFLFGSVSSKIVREAKNCAVWVVE